MVYAIPLCQHSIILRAASDLARFFGLVLPDLRPLAARLTYRAAVGACNAVYSVGSPALVFLLLSPTQALGRLTTFGQKSKRALERFISVCVLLPRVSFLAYSFDPNIVDFQ